MTTTSAVSAPAATRTRRSKIFSIELIRALSVILIVFTHFDNPFLPPERMLIPNEPFGIYVGSLGVSLFLSISGFVLALNYPARFDLKKFYFKRFKTLYPMFWIAWILATLYFFVTRGVVVNRAPLSSFVFTILGIDGLAVTSGIPAMYILGEWFLGFIIIFYLIFPLLNYCVEKHPIITAIVLLVLYASSLLFIDPSRIPHSIILTIRLPELALGIYLAKFKPQGSWIFALLGAVILSVSLFIPTSFAWDSVRVTIIGAAAFVLLLYVGNYLNLPLLRETVTLIAKYSYPIFLVHHVVIMDLFFRLDSSQMQQIELWLMFVAVCVITFGLSIALDRITRNTMQFFKSVTSGATQS